MSEPESLAVDEPIGAHLTRHSIDRLIMLSDGVFAIAITLSALEIRVPEKQTLAEVASTVGPSLLTYGLSFAVIAAFWTSNKDLFARIRLVDRTLTTLVLASLCLAALIPASVRIVVPSQGEFGGAFAFYALVMTLAGVANWAVWLWAGFRPGLMSDDVPRRYRLRRLVETAMLPAVFLLLFTFPDMTSLKWIAAGCLVALALRRFVLGRSGR